MKTQLKINWYCIVIVPFYCFQYFQVSFFVISTPFWVTLYCLHSRVNKAGKTKLTLKSVLLTYSNINAGVRDCKQSIMCSYRVYPEKTCNAHTTHLGIWCFLRIPRNPAQFSRNPVIFSHIVWLIFGNWRLITKFFFFFIPVKYSWK